MQFSSQREAEHDLSKSFKKPAHCKRILHNEKDYEKIYAEWDLISVSLLLLVPVVKVYVIKARTAIRVNESLGCSNNGPLGCPYRVQSQLFASYFLLAPRCCVFFQSWRNHKEGKWECWGKLAIWWSRSVQLVKQKFVQCLSFIFSIFLTIGHFFFALFSLLSDMNRFAATLNSDIWGYLHWENNTAAEKTTVVALQPTVCCFWYWCPTMLLN